MGDVGNIKHRRMKRPWGWGSKGGASGGNRSRGWLFFQTGTSFASGLSKQYVEPPRTIEGPRSKKQS